MDVDGPPAVAGSEAPGRRAFGGRRAVAAPRRLREAAARRVAHDGRLDLDWPGLTPMNDGLLKKAKPASTPSMARVNSTAVSMLTSTPRMSVRAKPLGEAVANTNSTTAVSIVRMLASRMVLKPRAYPS